MHSVSSTVINSKVKFFSVSFIKIQVDLDIEQGQVPQHCPIMHGILYSNDTVNSS